MYVVSYDISSDKLRTKVAKVLESYGMRIQYSVFECKLSEKKFRELYARLMELASDLSEDSIRFYYICKNCEEKIKSIGRIPPGREQSGENIIIV